MVLYFLPRSSKSILVNSSAESSLNLLFDFVCRMQNLGPQLPAAIANVGNGIFQSIGKFVKILLVEEDLVLFIKYFSFFTQTFFTFGNSQVIIFLAGCLNIKKVGSFSCSYNFWYKSLPLQFFRHSRS